MKSLQSILNVVLLGAVIVLFVLQFSAPKEDHEATAAVQEIEEPKVESQDGIEIRYFNSDSVWSQYEYIQELRTKYQSKQSQYQNTLEQKALNLEKEMVEAQKNFASMGPFQQEQTRNDLAKKEQELMTLREDYNERLFDAESKMLRQGQQAIVNELETFRSNGIDLIMSYSENSTIVSGADSLDITRALIDHLNKVYQEEQANADSKGKEGN